MSIEWKPGDVAMVTWDATSRRSKIMLRGTRGRWWEPTGSLHDQYVKDARPLVVIDPEDREQVERLAVELRRCFGDTGGVQDALRRLVTPPKPDVLEHLAVGGGGGVASALCGKVWRASDPSEVNVTGKCPKCSEVAEGGWTA